MTSYGNDDAPRRVLITGGANGFGLATAAILISQGSQVAIGDVDEQQLEKATNDLASPNLLPLSLDVTSLGSIKACVDACKQQFGGLDTLINSAGVIDIAPLSEVTEKNWDFVLDVDLKGLFFMSQAAAPLISESGRGRIVNIGSDASKVGFAQIHAYCAAKHAVAGLTKSLAGELAPHHVTVNCVCPVGSPNTGMGKWVMSWKKTASGLSRQEIEAATASDIPMKRNATEADVANAIMFFLSDSSDFLTGLILDVDGGMLSTIPIPGAAD
jgi:NAD(P)-dependent dehydrogenase (short-subunit alcohol dehydrogenase family)